jgi:hypothetical protein
VHLLRVAIEPTHFAWAIHEAVLLRVREVEHLLLMSVVRAGRECVQHWLPDMRRAAVHQRHASAALAAHPIAEFCREQQARDAASNDHDSHRLAHGNYSLTDEFEP